MKNIYKFLSGVIVMLITITSMIAFAGTSMHSAPSGTGIIINPESGLTMNPGETQPKLIKPKIPENTDRLILPFFEPWDMGSFAFQQWTFIPSQGNWAISTTEGDPLPTAIFTGTPALTNYDYT